VNCGCVSPFGQSVSGIWIIVWSSEDILDECVLQSCFEDFYDSMAVNIKLRSCDKLFEPGDKGIQVIPMFQCL